MGIQMASLHRPDLILMDIQLPGIDGLEATQMIKENQETRKIPVVALTSYAMPGDEFKAQEAGCAGYITKPINTRTFMESIRGYLDHSLSSKPRPEKKIVRPEKADFDCG